MADPGIPGASETNQKEVVASVSALKNGVENAGPKKPFASKDLGATVVCKIHTYALEKALESPVRAGSARSSWSRAHPTQQRKEKKRKRHAQTLKGKLSTLVLVKSSLGCRKIRTPPTKRLAQKENLFRIESERSAADCREGAEH